MPALAPVYSHLPLLIRAKKAAQQRLLKKKNEKAGDGNRTHVSSLEGWCSTIELHPHIYKALGPRNLMHNAQSRNRTSDTRIFSPLLYQLSYLGFFLDVLPPIPNNRNYYTHKERKCQ